MPASSRSQVGRRDPDTGSRYGERVRRLARRLYSSFLPRNEAGLPTAAVLRLAAIACGALDRERLRRHAEWLAAGAGIGTADAGRCGEAAALHLVGRIDATSGDAVAAARLGHRLLCDSRNRVLQLAAVMAAGMAERWDGGGAPCGLRGDAIPLSARIAAVVLRFEEAMLAQRGGADAARAAVSAVMAEAGTVLDPVLAVRLRLLVETGAGSGNAADPGSGNGTRRPALRDAASPALVPVLVAVAAARRVRAALPS